MLAQNQRTYHHRDGAHILIVASLSPGYTRCHELADVSFWGLE